ncbi:hypothetical protein EVAR_4148_1 [Eumeta japonica]|uniref:Uncharacterized protein n=1 Tax=Eumeta variegata TaxID=151549 RepID=A0A4C1TFX6_EUMVA|nr:hypothetical protein EVAR_4148_1 [Eumeta japonica]
MVRTPVFCIVRGISTTKLLLLYIYNIARLSDNRLTYRLTSWVGPSGSRNRGRPAAQWTDDITQMAGDRETFAPYLEERIKPSGLKVVTDDVGRQRQPASVETSTQLKSHTLTLK